MRHTIQPLGDLAERVLFDAERAQLGKTAAATYVSGESSAGGLMRKIAAEVRSHKPAQPTYQDLNEFRKRHGV